MDIIESPLRVCALREAHVARTADMLAEAFATDAAYGYLFPGVATRRAGLCDFFARNLRTHLPYACTFVALDADERPIATVTLRPPRGIHISFLTMLRRGLLPFAIAHGRAAVQRLFWLKHTYDALEAEAAAHTAHAYVHMMAVAPEYQGRGIGSRLLAEVLETHASPSVVTQTVLTTHLERNVVFYRRHGFELLSQRTLQPPGGAPYAIWSMLRPGGGRT
jgi:ribosomal protein S18 acetylase RimI-like enzyme